MFYPTPESGARKIWRQIVWQTLQKPTPVFWRRFLDRVSGVLLTFVILVAGIVYVDSAINVCWRYALKQVEMALVIDRENRQLLREIQEHAQYVRVYCVLTVWHNEWRKFIIRNADFVNNSHSHRFHSHWSYSEKVWAGWVWTSTSNLDGFLDLMILIGVGKIFVVENIST